MKKENIPAEILDRVEAELMAGERLLWVGQPDPGQRIFAEDTERLMITSSILTALLLALGVSFFLAPPQVLLPLIVGLLVLVVVGGFLATIAENYVRARRRIYAITDRRALIISGLFKTEIRSYSRHNIGFIERHIRKGDNGDLLFAKGERDRAVGIAPFIRRQMVEQKIGFFAIDNIREVEAIMLEAFQGDQIASRLVDEADIDNAMDNTDLSDEAQMGHNIP